MKGQYRLITFDRKDNTYEVGQASFNKKDLEEIAKKILHYSQSHGNHKYCEIVDIVETYL